MEKPRLGKSVIKVIQLQKDAAGNTVPVVLYRKRGHSKRKISSALKPLDTLMRRVASAQVAFANTYLDKHNRSNEKRRDGWIVDLIPNVADASRNSVKKLRPDVDDEDEDNDEDDDDDDDEDDDED
jgi:hypothetical protein